MKERDGNEIEVGFVDPEDAKDLRRARIRRGATLLDAARAAGVAMDATCGARGRCRSCRCKVLSGDVSPATMQDTLQLGHEEVQERLPARLPDPSGHRLRGHGAAAEVRGGATRS